MASEQNKTPLLDAMRAYAAGGALAFHTPGHKQGKGIHEAFRDIITPQGLAMEVSLMDELDNLFAAQTCIKEAQQLTAELYGADAAYFSVNGTTGAIHTMVMAVLNPGDTILLPRNAHRSIIGAVMLAGAKPVFMQPEVAVDLGIPMAVSVATLEAGMRQHPHSKAVLLINPTYYGVACDLAKAAELIHANGMVLLVDEAHGPHLAFNDQLPAAAMDAGADLAAQSTHKILGSFTQTSILLAKLKRVDGERLRMMNSVLQSTSPNYLLLASLDVARMQMATEGRQRLGNAVRLALWVRREINAIEGLQCFGAERLDGAGAFALDWTKLTVTVNALGLSGAEAERILRKEYNIQAELSDCYNVLFILSYSDSEAEAARLVAALRSLAAKFRGRGSFRIAVPPLPALPEQALLPREALFAAKETVLFSAAAGKISGEMITFYPPGIPLICPGERITDDIIAHCTAMQAIGLNVVGPKDTTLNFIEVVK